MDIIIIGGCCTTQLGQPSHFCLSLPKDCYAKEKPKTHDRATARSYRNPGTPTIDLQCRLLSLSVWVCLVRTSEPQMGKQPKEETAQKIEVQVWSLTCTNAIRYSDNDKTGIGRVLAATQPDAPARLLHSPGRMLATRSFGLGRRPTIFRSSGWSALPSEHQNWFVESRFFFKGIVSC